ncbi:hypothetical protein I2F27_00255 [Acinetobacter sp. B5B]|uniref:hypothetical protein n=1 Tax=Acinetobacter baretiae TaxID=2605383 RepID=UPI0018C2BCC1|nr:hypothetical protein [Acinetobacter baretiae]MBF7681770.1 hypothetical protein [Acinetobacter baretiae]MBF7685379.1 hypothetical protein [Acinetobacter baretiae]
MSKQSQDELLHALKQHNNTQKKLDRILYIVLPIVSFLISMICANLNWQSTLATFLILSVALIAVSIKRLPLLIGMIIVAVYCVIDNIFSYGTFKLSPFKMQAGTMISFMVIIYFARPRLDQLMRNSRP